MIHTYEVNGVMVTIQIEPSPDGTYTATIGEREYSVEVMALRDGGWLLNIGGERLRVYGAAQGSTRYVNVAGRQHTLTVPDMSRRRRAGGGGGDLTAQMPGQVLDVLVRAGDAVEPGQTLLLLEAMKMEIRVAAPRAGVVKRLLVSTGAVVERGQKLVEIEEA